MNRTLFEPHFSARHKVRVEGESDELVLQYSLYSEPASEFFELSENKSAVNKLFDTTKWPPLRLKSIVNNWQTLPIEKPEDEIQNLTEIDILFQSKLVEDYRKWMRAANIDWIADEDIVIMHVLFHPGDHKRYEIETPCEHRSKLFRRVLPKVDFHCTPFREEFGMSFHAKPPITELIKLYELPQFEEKKLILFQTYYRSYFAEEDIFNAVKWKIKFGDVDDDDDEDLNYEVVHIRIRKPGLIVRKR